MACAVDPSPASGRQLAKQTSSTSVHSLETLLSTDSGVEQSAIDQVMNRRWIYSDVADLLNSQLAVLPGGRDRNGGAIIVIQGSPQMDYKTLEVGKVLSYLMRIPPEAVQQHGFTIVMDMRRVSWPQTKRVLDALKVLFVDHIHQVLVMRPKSFWQRQRSGMSFNTRKSKYRFKCVMLEHSADLYNHISSTQMPIAQNGYLDYNHQHWMDTQRVLEQFLLEFLSRRDSYDSLKGLLEHYKDPETLSDAKEAVRQHVQLCGKLSRPDLDHQCERMTHIMGKLRPGTNNPDFQASFQFLEELGVSLRNTLSVLEGLWETKGTKLDHGLQFKLFEHDSQRLIEWMSQQCRLLSRQLTDIGADSKTASTAKKSVDEFKNSIQMQLQDVTRVITMSERLVQASHPAAGAITSRAEDMRSERDKLVGVVEARIALLHLSVLFHDKLNTFFQQSEAWVDMCSSHDQPANTRATEDTIKQHHHMKEQYTQLYNDARRDGHSIIEQLKRPVGDSSVPSQFIIGSRHVKEDLENLYDEKNLLDGQWDVRHNFLKQTLNFRLYQRDTNKILMWISDVGNMFLTTNNSIGVDVVSSEQMLKRHDTFDMDSEVPLVYGQSSKLISKAAHLAAKQECPPQQVKEEASSLEASINNFAGRLDERREIMLLAVACFKASDNALKELSSIQVPIPASQFEGPSAAVEEHLMLFRGSHEAACKMADSVLTQWNTLRTRLSTAQASNVTAGCNMEYAPAIETVDSKTAQLMDERNKMERYCETREQRWTWCLQRDQLIHNMEKHLTEQEVWLRDQSDTLELAENEEEAQLRLEIFQRQYTTLVESHDALIERGHDLNQRITQLDQELFNREVGKEMREKVERMVVRVKERRARMEQQAAPRLQLLKECLQYFVHDQTAQELLAGLKELSQSMRKLTGVGHTLREAQALQQKVADAIKMLQELEGRGQSFTHLIESSVGEGQYQAVMLRVMCTTISNKMAGVKRALTDQQRVIKASVEFHQNYDKLQTVMQRCQAQFSSRDSAHSLKDIETQQCGNTELKVWMEDATGLVRSHGHQLITILRNTTNTAYVVGGAEPVDEVDNGREEMESSGTGRLVVLTRKRVQSSRSKSPVPSSSPEEQGHIVIQGLVDKMAAGVTTLSQLWTKRNDQLELCKKVIEFEQQVPEVFKWLDDVGVVFLNRRHDYGRSLEEVRLRLDECSVFERDKMNPVSQQVDGLRSMMKQFEDAGHYELNKLRGTWSQLDRRWKSFEEDMKIRMNNLELSLSFQDNVFEGSNWCQKSEQLLQELEQKMSECDIASEVASLIEELTIYLSVTREEQMGRVNKIKQISVFLHSNSLVELGSQVEASTQSMLREISAVKEELQSLHDKLVRIEEEKDRERRLNKQKERVLEEIVETEQIYTRDLRLIVEVCLPRYISASRSEGWPPSLKGKDHIVFGNVKAIKEYHAEELLPQVEEAAMNGLDSVAQVFVKEASAIASFYVPYCQNKTASDDLMASHRSYLSRVQSQLGIEDPLSSLLIKPIQRITKYPLLLKDALKYTTQLGQPTAILEQALAVVQEIPVQTNNAIHLSLLDMGDESTHKLGELIYQGIVMVSEPRLLLTVEKERQVFVFERAVVFSRRVELGQAKFKYEYKFKMALSSGVHIIDNMESEPCKFGVFTSDHRIHLKAPTAVIKGQWVHALKIAAQSCHEEEEAARIRSLTMATRLRSTLRDDVTQDLKSKGGRQVRNSPFIGRHPNSPFLPRRPSSPFSSHRIIMAAATADDRPPSPAVETYKATMDYIPGDEDQHGLALKTGQVVEVLEQLTAANRCFVRSTAITGEIEHGWIPASLLEPVEQPAVQHISDEDDATDHGHMKQSRVKSVLFTDSNSQQVISNLRRVTLGVDLGAPPPRSPTRSPTRSPVFSPKHLHRQGHFDDQQRLHESLSPPATETNGSSSKMRTRERSKLRRNYGVRRKSSSNRSRSNSQSSDGESCLERALGSGSSEEEGDEETVSVTFADTEKDDHVEEKEVSPEQRERAREKIKYIMAELVSTEKEYISKLETLVTGFLHEMQSGTALPEPLKGKEKMIFGNVVAIYEFHRDIFQHSLVEANDSLEKTAQCFLDSQKNFQLYVTYCENKPKSESWLWTYTHNGGCFFTDIQKKLGVREDIASFLIKPVQRVTKYQLLLKDLMKTAQKTGSPVPLLESAVQLMKDVPKQANDAMALSMIVGYDGNIHANGAIILQDEFMVYEKVRLLGGAKRHVFLLDSRLLITKDKDADGLYVFKDSLKVHSMTLTEKQGDHPCRFAIGTGQIGDWEQFYVLEASSPDRKQQWVVAIKEILNQQFEMLKALKLPTMKPRLPGQDSLSYQTPPNGSPALSGSDHHPKLSVTNKHQPTMDLGFSDSSLDDDDEVDGEEGEKEPAVEKQSPQRLRSVPAPPTITDQKKTSRFSRWKSVGDKKSREPVLYQVGEDCSAPAHGQNILYIKKGQIYDILDNSGEWWMARLIRDIDNGGSPRTSSRGLEGWVPATFMDPFPGQLEVEEYMFACYGNDEGSRSRSLTAPSKHRDTPVGLSTPDNKITRANRKSPKPHKKAKHQHLLDQQTLTGKPQFLSRIGDETVLHGRPVQFKCQLAQEYPGQSVQWLHDGHPLTIDRGFTSEGQTCVLKINDVHLEDEGVFTCVVRTPRGSSSCCAKLTVLGPPKPPTGLVARPITSTSVSLTWDPPIITGHSPISLYLIECKDTIGNRWSTMMQRITEPCSVIDDLVPGVEYEFRVIAGNQIGSSLPSQGSAPVKLVRHTPLRPVFSVEPFDSQYSLQDELNRGQFSRLQKCLHSTTQQEYVAKVFTMETGDHAQRELNIVCKLSHRNIVQMTGAYLSDIGYIIVYQCIHGGKGILEYICHTDTPPNEHLVIHSFHQLFSALSYLHNLNIAHLQLKPENILLSPISCTGSLPDLKIIHFASAVELSSTHTLAPPSTDLEFTAPEVLLKEPVSTATDMWSVGALLYTILGGHPPFLVDSVDLTKENIKTAHLCFSSRQFRGCNDAAKSLISQLLLRQLSDRLTASQCCKHSWITDDRVEDSIIDTSRLSNYLLVRKNQCSPNH